MPKFNALRQATVRRREDQMPKLKTSDTYQEFADNCQQAWLDAGGDIEVARAESHKHMAAETNDPSRIDTPPFSWNNRPGMRGGADSPNRAEEELKVES